MPVGPAKLRRAPFLCPCFFASRTVWGGARIGFGKAPCWLGGVGSWGTLSRDNSVISSTSTRTAACVCLSIRPQCKFLLGDTKFHSWRKNNPQTRWCQVCSSSAVLWPLLLYKVLGGLMSRKGCPELSEGNCYGATRWNNIPVKHSVCLLLKVVYKSSEFLNFP